MDSVLFTIGGTEITLAQTALAGVVLAVVLLGVVIAMLRQTGQRNEASAQASLDGLRASFTQQIADRDTRIRELSEKLDAERVANGELKEEAATLRTRLSEQHRQNEENLKRFQNARQQMTDEFKVIATDILKSHGETFSKQNREQVDALLKPLNEKIGEFQKGLLQDRAAMGAEIKRLAEESLRMSGEAQNLTRALKGNAQVQGAWGEMILSSILERSGLREGEQYITQQSYAADGGGRVRTDVEVMMPNGDSVIVDSKVSLVAFEAYSSATDDDERDRQLKAHVTSLRTHIKTLGGKEYHRHAGSGLDFVMMFVPIEPAFASAMAADPGLFDFALDQGVVLATPTTLMSALRTIRNVWDTEKRHQNAEVIAERAGALYDKVAGFLGSMDKLGTHLDRAHQSFEDARGQLSTGRGSVVRQVEMLRELGAKSSKSLPAGWEGSDALPPADDAPERDLLSEAEDEAAD